MTLHRTTTAAIHRELRRRSRKVESFQRRRLKLLGRLRTLDEIVALYGGTPNGHAKARRRPQNDRTLVEALQSVLARKPLSVTQAAEAVQKAGYRTSSSNFRTVCSIALGRGPFRRVSRGVYAVRGAKP